MRSTHPYTDFSNTVKFYVAPKITSFCRIKMLKKSFIDLYFFKKLIGGEGMWGFIDTLCFVLVIILSKVLYYRFRKRFSILYLISLLIFLLSRNMFVDKNKHCTT